MMQVGGYTLLLYCDVKGRFEHKEGLDDPTYLTSPIPIGEYVGEIRSKCRSMARRDGWVLHKDGRATCPECNPKRKKK